jgi:hypothetical protein
MDYEVGDMYDSKPDTFQLAAILENTVKELGW